MRHLLSEAPGIIAVVLAGDGIRFVAQTAELARAMQPAIVVLEDVDPIAADRNLSVGPQPLLFAILDALDGLDALADRPGPIDLAVEIPLPDDAACLSSMRAICR